MEQPSGRRRRPPLSCIECRRRKIKCDRTNPCANCVTSKITCTYKVCGTQITSHTPTGHHANTNTTSSSSVPEARPSVVNNPINMSTPNPGNTSNLSYVSTREVSTATPQSRLNGPSSNHEGTRPTDTPQNDHTTHIHPSRARPESEHLQSLSRTPRSPESNRELLTLRSQLQDAQISINKARVLKWSYWMAAADEFDVVCAAFHDYDRSSQDVLPLDDEYTALKASINQLLRKCKSLAKIIKIERPSRCLSLHDFSLLPPSREISDVMVNAYFDSFESIFRILHIPSFWVEYRRYWSNLENNPISLGIKILLVVAIGSGLKSTTEVSTDFRNRCQQWVYASQVWLSGPLEKDRLDISGIQIYCLTLLARQVLSIGGDLIWTSMGSLIHRAMQIGLHRDPYNFPRMTVLQAEIRRRLWATILEMAVQSSLDSSMPPRLNLDEFDTKAPSNINDHDVDEHTSAIQAQSSEAYTSTSIQLLLLDSLPSRLRIVQLLNGLHSELSYIDVLALSSEIVDACRACTSFLKTHNQSPIQPFHRNMLDYLTRRFLLPLHCPFATQVRINPLFSHSVRVGLDAAMVLLSPEPDESYYNVRVTGGGLFREGFRAVQTAISMELLSLVETQRLDGTLNRVSQYRELLKLTLKDMIALTLERVRRGETNVKSHMFLCMILAQVEAAEQDTDCNIKMAESAKDSLELCHSLLLAQVDTSAYSSMGSIDSLGFEQEVENAASAMGFDLLSPDEDFTWV